MGYRDLNVGFRTVQGIDGLESRVVSLGWRCAGLRVRIVRSSLLKLKSTLTEQAWHRRLRS